MSKQTNNALDEAIRAETEAEGWSGVITGWVVLVGYVDTTPDGEAGSGIGTIYPSGSQPWPMTLGIIEAGRLRAQQEFLSPGDDQ